LEPQGGGNFNKSVLTIRELDVLKLICEGQPTKAVADILGISFKTVVTHRCHLMEKAGVHDVVSLFRWAIEQGFISAPSKKLPGRENPETSNEKQRRKR